MKRLIAYLMDNVFIDFQGNLSLEMVREFLREDNSAQSRALLARLVEDGGINEMMTVLADCLQENLSQGITAETMLEQVNTYSES